MRIISSIATLLLCSSAAQASLLENPDFSQQLDGWTQESGSWVHNLGDGIPGPGGSAGTTSPGASSAALTQCVDLSTVPGDTGLVLRAWVITGDHSSFSQVQIELYDAPGCSGSLEGEAEDPFQTPSLEAWNLTYTTIGLPAGGVQSALVRLRITNDGPGQQTRFDAVRLDRNLVTNGHFTTDLSGWIQNSGTWTQVADGLSTPPGAAQAEVAANGSAFLSRCVVLQDFPGSVVYLAMIRIKAVTALNNTVLSFQFWDDQQCGGTSLSGPGVIANNSQLNTWETIATNLFPPPPAVAIERPRDARSVAVFVALNPGQGSPGDVFLVDDFALVPSDILFLDGLESGDTLSWSTTTP